MKKRSKAVVIFSGKESLTLISIILCLFIIVLLNAVDFGQPCSPQCYPSFSHKKNIILEKTNTGIYLALIQKDYISEHIRRSHIWEENTTNFIIKNIKPGDTVVECGANIGYYTTMFARLFAIANAYQKDFPAIAFQCFRVFFLFYLFDGGIGAFIPF